MEPIYIQTVLQKQKAFFSAGKTFPVSTRKTALKKLLDSLESYEAELTSALHADLGKSAAESYMCEIGLVICCGICPNMPALAASIRP